VEAALRSGAIIYLPPRWPGDSHLLVFTAQKLNTRSGIRPDGSDSREPHFTRTA